VCSDTTSQYYNPSDPSCTTGNNPICTNPSYPGYNPNDPSCAPITNAALVAAGAAGTAAATGTTAVVATTPDYSSLIWIGGGLLVLFMLMRK